ncbi:universal stress protein [Halomonas sp.]|uniref:universal stress protein n=1 Tax=Halomonas sp. TaxID=1486246 RepID=UPI0026374B0C|nr:universal stress protein [Halomonas sp.]
MNQEYRHILCCVGLKIDCEPVLAHAVRLALAIGADLEVVHAVKSLSDDVLNTLRANIPNRDVLENLREQRLKDATEELERKIEAFWASYPALHEAFDGRDMKRSVLEGYPAEEITNYAQRCGSDMIVMAANKHSFAATYAGKVTKGVIKRSKVPVVVVPPHRN